MPDPAQQSQLSSVVQTAIYRTVYMYPMAVLGRARM
jgi:hypothetical protein